MAVAPKISGMPSQNRNGIETSPRPASTSATTVTVRGFDARTAT